MGARLGVGRRLARFGRQAAARRSPTRRTMKWQRYRTAGAPGSPSRATADHAARNPQFPDLCSIFQQNGPSYMNTFPPALAVRESKGPHRWRIGGPFCEGVHLQMNSIARPITAAGSDRWPSKLFLVSRAGPLSCSAADKPNSGASEMASSEIETRIASILNSFRVTIEI